MSQMGLNKKSNNIAVFGWLGLPIVGWQGRKGPSSWKAFVAPSASLWQKPCSIRWWRGPTSWGWRGSPTLGRVSSRFFAQAGHETTYSMNHQWCPRERPLRKTPLRPLSTHLGGLSIDCMHLVKICIFSLHHVIIFWDRKILTLSFFRTKNKDSPKEVGVFLIFLLWKY